MTSTSRSTALSMTAATVHASFGHTGCTVPCVRIFSRKVPTEFICSTITSVRSTPNMTGNCIWKRNIPKKRFYIHRQTGGNCLEIWRCGDARLFLKNISLKGNENTHRADDTTRCVFPPKIETRLDELLQLFLPIVNNSFSL